MKQMLKLLLLLGFVLSVSACGKISDPKPVENSGYPHVYPRN